MWRRRRWWWYWDCFYFILVIYWTMSTTWSYIEMKGLAGSPRSTDVRHLVFKVLSFHLLFMWYKRVNSKRKRYHSHFPMSRKRERERGLFWFGLGYANLKWPTQSEEQNKGFCYKDPKTNLYFKQRQEVFI